jgi:hypothetical protein
MSGEVDLSKLRKWIGKAEQIGDPPAADRRVQQAAIGAGRDALVQFNVKVTPSVKKRVKQLAARDEITLTLLVARMVDLYEKEYGALPGGKPKDR